MRIIAGIYRSRVLKRVESNKTRETRDMIKEAIFNHIGPYFSDEVVLDLFCGSGSLGIEALSRGAKQCYFNDASKEATNVVNENMRILDIKSSGIVTNQDFLSFLLATSQVFDIIFLDPPYSLDVTDEIIEVISKRKLLSNHGIIILLTGKLTLLKDEIFDIIKYKEKTKGITKISYWKRG